MTGDSRGFGSAAGWEDAVRAAESEGVGHWMGGMAGAVECNEAYSGMGHEAVWGR